MSAKEAMTQTPCTLMSKEQVSAYFKLFHNKFNQVGKEHVQIYIIRTYSGVNEAGCPRL